MADAEYVDPKTLGLPAGTEDQAWLAAQVERIDPWHMEQGHDGAYTRALEKLALELRAKNATESKRLDWCIKVLMPYDDFLITDTGCGCCGDRMKFKQKTDGRAAIDAAMSTVAIEQKGGAA
jgi:hypothetical protein